MMMVVVVLEYNRIRDGMKVKERRKVDASPQLNACARSSVSPNHQLTQPVLTVLIPELSDGRDVKVAVGNSADNKTPAAPVQVRTSSKGFSFLCCGLGNKGEGEENGPTTAKGDGPAAGNNKGAIQLCSPLIPLPLFTKIPPLGLRFSFEAFLCLPLSKPLTSHLCGYWHLYAGLHLPAKRIR